MSSTDEDRADHGRVIERLLTDPVFRAAFRRDPAEACRAHGLDDLANALSPGGSMHTLELRESKSSLAGVIMALAAEGIGFAELTGLVGQARGAVLPHPSPSVAREAAVKLPAGPVEHHAVPIEPGNHVLSLVDSAPGGSAAGASRPVAELLANPHLSLPAEARSELLEGEVDPRAVSMLQDIVSHHTIVVGGLQVATEPVHAQALDIVSVDGQPVGPGNVAARDLLTEIAALDPSLRPDQIGSPWPIQSPGFFSDPSQPGRLHLAFVSSAGHQPAAPSTPELVGSTAPARPHIATAADAATPAPAGAASTTPGQYVRMLPADAQIGRTDMGVDVDLKPGEPIVAPGTSRVLGIAPDWYRGQPYVALQLLDGPMKGHNYYIAEQITPAVSTGQVVQPGQPIGHYAASGTGIEMGWASANWEQTLAQATTGYSEGQVTPAGASFHSFLESLSPSPAHVAASAPAGIGMAGDQAATPAAAVQTASAATPAPVKPVTAAFAAVPHHKGRAFQRQTIQFRALSSPPANPAAAGDLSTAAAPTGGAISLTSPLLTSGQQEFAGRLAGLTGLDPRVVSAWALAEESGGAAQNRQGQGNFDWLNIGYFDSGPGQIAFDSAFKDPVTAAEQTARFLQGTWGGASASIRAILATAGHDPQQQIDAIASSDWASSHYGGGANLRATYDELSNLQITRT